MLFDFYSQRSLCVIKARRTPFHAEGVVQIGGTTAAAV
jgi:hypothetical protein